MSCRVSHFLPETSVSSFLKISTKESYFHTLMSAPGDAKGVSLGPFVLIPPTNRTLIQLSLVTLPLNSCLEASTLNPFHIPDPIDHFLILNHQGGICDKCRKVGEELEIAETYSLIAWNDYFPYICIVYLKIFNEISYL